jgi:hypothetical protein
MTRLETAPSLQGRAALYFGCWDSPGHFLHSASGAHLWRRPSDFPWSDALLDGGLLENGGIADEPTGRVYWTCGGVAFWYAFYWWDRSIDRRAACNSGFYVRGFGFPEKSQAFDYACATFAAIVARQRFPLILQ